LDGFKKINDDYSHKAGDAVLREVAQRMRAITRANDTIARWGGDEFVILLEEISQETLDHLVERLRKKIELPIEHEGHLLRVGTSIGIAVYPNHPAELDEMLKIADKHMYHDKAHRKLQPSSTIENSAKEG
jgi:diguanylate cyclase (GGDEF)-like protein